MNNEKTIDKGSAEKFHCPATGLPIFRKPEWTDVRFGKDYKLTISIIGENIVFSKSVGFATLNDVEGVLRFDARVRTDPMIRL